MQNKFNELGSSLYQHSDSIAEKALEAQEFVEFKSQVNKSLQTQITQETTNSLIEYIGSKLQNNEGTKGVRNLAGTKGDEAAINEQLVTTTLSTIPFIEKGIWEFFKEKCLELDFSVSEVIELNQIINPLISEFSYYYVSSFVENNTRQKEDFNKKLTELSIPIIQVYKEIAICPLIGEIDDERANLLMETSLSRTKEAGIAYLILDLSGVTSVNTFVAQHLLNTAEALKIMGVKVIITGLSPAISTTIVELGIDLQSISITSSLHKAFVDLELFKK
ncbi:STAS domain-containing protein [Halobacillus naozhouensis]|uniref:STAS domain-containing protein n=1 Tax=Halobacillus naozhouensis TaxID=554880 RepID=A0ABY8IW83_9BACI|nr:STAS domain-containing protein [Halobacillus naozhouensis]WFT74077.1 STAS domain-containing protein [Halobacillus naozhouensis]